MISRYYNMHHPCMNAWVWEPPAKFEIYKWGQVLLHQENRTKNAWYKCFFIFSHSSWIYFFKTILKGNNFVKLSWKPTFESIHRFGLLWRSFFLLMAVHGVIVPLCWRPFSRPWRFCVFEPSPFWVSQRIMHVKPFIGEIFADLWSWGCQEVWLRDSQGWSRFCALIWVKSSRFGGHKL